MATKTDNKTKAAAKVEGSKLGVVESDKRSKSRTVAVSYQAKHPKYGKYVAQRTVLQVHDEANVSKLGDIVEVIPCRPMSKSKSWQLVRVVESRAAKTAALASAKALS